MTKTVTKINIDHIVNHDFEYVFIPEDQSYKEFKKSCGCSDVIKKEDNIHLIIKKDKFPAVEKNIPKLAYDNGKRDYLKTVNITFFYEDYEHQYFFEIKVKENE